MYATYMDDLVIPCTVGVYFFNSRRIPDMTPIVYISSDLSNIAFQARITNISVMVGFRTECPQTRATCYSRYARLWQGYCNSIR